ncbi:hypothetical protein RHGRI_015291 [Rhododendron griersonianum]|uniref:non-specific serine/threonine protein kinase n=1 Tax=Rhododendron griersonianum TaxID=479676 RepID=A0AAV6KD96_9ERIC|nr:hypothetical protein RHGRI_015291 [Rhododendron griersonianum]
MTNLLSLLCFLSLLSNPSSSQPTEFTYTAFNQIGTNITLSGSSQILKNGILKLTNDTSRLKGHAFYTSPLKFKNSPDGPVFSFSTCFAVAIVPEYKKLGGHGLAFALSSTRDFRSALPSQYLGLLNNSDVGNFSNHLFAVEFDTVQDFEFRDINDNHVGIDINSLESNESAAAAYYTTDMKKQDLNLKSGKPILVWIDYDSASTQINITISPSSTKPRLPIISYQYDLSPLLHERMYVGFSASTGLLASSHYLLGWSFKMNGVAKSLSFNSLPSLPGPKKKQTALIIGISVSSFVFLVASILSGIYLVWKIKNRDVIEDWELEIGPHRYSYHELKQATKGFKDNELLGAGGFGRVYKGTLPNSKAPVAVKRISHNSRQGLREFVSEIASIGRLRHRNLVQPSMRQVVRYLEGEVPLPDDLRPPWEGNGGGGGGGGGGEGFDGYENSFLSSSFEKGSYSSFRRGDVDANFGSISASPLSLLHTRDAR